MWDDAEVIGYLISKASPLFWKHLSHKVQDCVGEVFLRWIVPIMGDVSVHDGPEPLDGIEMRAIGRQWDQMTATVFAQQKRSDIGAFVVWGIVQNDVNDTFIRVPRLNLGEKLNGANSIDGGWFNKGRVEGFQVQSAVNVHAPTPRCRLNGWI